MKHKDDCDFEEIIKDVSRCDYSTGSGEIQGSIDVSIERICFSDGYNFYMSLPFIYCPCCGVKLRERNYYKGD